MFQATLKNDPEAKKKAFEQWGLEEKHGMSFDAEKVLCYTCKPGDKPAGIAVQHCEIRKCAIEKGFDCCIKCDELSSCKKGAFTSFPEFHKGVVSMQEKYRKAQA
ncbi:MAG: DUF3795 domain-containing protein [Bacteroidales bacterium]|nr:DUF3795 domain-containing protein [Bacteroidales bacterium]